MIGEKELHLMKPTAILVNIARGPIVDHDALVKALKNRWIARAGLDVFDEKPLPQDDPLLDLGNVTLTPHIASNTKECRRRLPCRTLNISSTAVNAIRPRCPVNNV